VNASSRSRRTALPPRVTRLVKVADDYSRLSMINTDADVAKPAAQVERIRPRVLELGAVPRDSYVDPDASAWDPNTYREGFEALLVVLAGPDRPDYLAVYHWDRIVRQMEDAARLIPLLARGETLVITPGGVLDMNNPTDNMIAYVYSLFAANESSAQSRRRKGAIADRRAAGVVPLTGIRPFGLSADRMRPHPTEGPAVRAVAARHLAGESLTDLAVWLNGEGFRMPTPANPAGHGQRQRGGGTFNANAVRRILLRPSNVGLYAMPEPGEPGQIMAVAETLLDRATWDALHAVCSGRRRGGRPEGALSPLSGLLHCQLCGTGLVHKGIRYVCPGGRMGRGCGQIAVAASHVERVARDLVVGMVSNPRHASKVAALVSERSQERRDLESQAARWRARLDALAGNVELTERELSIRRRALVAKLEPIDQALGALPDVGVPAHLAVRHERLARTAAERRWDEGSAADRRDLVRSVCKGFVIAKPSARGSFMVDGHREYFDYSRVQPLHYDAETREAM
jgi:DNA invertase Pin-like site-specific DNA recombinase